MNQKIHKDYFEVHAADYNEMMQMLTNKGIDGEIPSFTQSNTKKRPNHSLDLPLTLKPLTLAQKINAVKLKHAQNRADYERNRQ